MSCLKAASGLLLTLIIFLQHTVSIYAFNVKINEVMPSPSSGNEWIEIYNPENIDISNWKVEEKTSNGNTNPAHILTSLVNGEIFDVYYFSSSALNNDGDTVTLIDDQNKPFDSFSYENSSSGVSYARIPDGEGDFIATQNPTKGISNGTPSTSPTPTSTPTSEPSPTPTINPSPTPTITPTATAAPVFDYGNIVITEVYPSPNSGEKEWVELYNGNDEDANLETWVIEDKSGHSTKIHDFIIPKKSYKVFEINGGTLTLNNDGDWIKLSNSQNVQKHALPSDYPKINKGYSWSIVYNQWCITASNSGKMAESCLEQEEDPEATPQPTGTPISKTTSVKTAEPQASDEASLSAEEKRKLPDITLTSTDQPEASVAGVYAINEKTRPSIVFPVGIALLGIMCLGAAAFPYLKPKLEFLLQQAKLR